MKYSNRLFIVWIALISAVPVFSQECPNTLPDNVDWTGTSNGSSKWKNGQILDLKIEKIESGKYIISDITAGFFISNGIPYKVEVEISIDCSATIATLNFASDFGDGSVKSGEWNPTTRELTIRWEIPANNLNETSIFQIQ